MFDLERAGPFEVEQAPLVAAIAQVRFPLIARLQSLAGIAPLQERMAEFLPYMEQVNRQQVLLSLGPSGSEAPPATEQTHGWKFTNDAGWTLSIEPGSATLSVGAGYTTGVDFAREWRDMLEALAGDVGVARCDRIGVRYVNLIDIPPGDDTSWLAWLQPALTGILGGAIFSDGTQLRTYVTQVHLVGAPGEPHAVQAVFRYGFLPPMTQIAFQPLSSPLQIPVAGFLLDIDLFIEGPQPFDVERLTAEYDHLHEQQDKFFLWSLTEEGKNHFGVRYERGT